MKISNVVYRYLPDYMPTVRAMPCAVKGQASDNLACSAF